MDRREVLIAAGASLLLGAAPSLARAQQAGVVITDMVLGAADAPVEVIEYASFTCPHCARFHTDVAEPLKRDYVDTGKVRFVYREVYFDRPGLWAAMVARCAGEARYFGVVDILYRTQAEWTAGDGATIAQNLRRIGLSVGLTDAEIDQCMQDAAMAQAMLDHYEANRAEYPIEGTPAVVIDGELYGNMPYNELTALIEARLAAQ